METNDGLGGVEAGLAALSGPQTPAPEVQANTPAPAPSASPSQPEAVAPASEVPALDVAPPAPAETPAAPAADPDAALAERIERAVARTAEQQRTQREAAERLAAYERREAERQAERERIARDPLALARHLGELGWDPDSLVQALASQDPRRPEAVRATHIEQELEKTRRELDELRQETQRERAQAQLADFKRTIIPALESKKEDFSHTLAMFEPAEIQEAVVAEMTRLYQSSGGQKRYSVQEAAASIEAHLRAKVKRIQGFATVPGTQAPAAPAATAMPATPKPAPKTLTNEMAATTDSAPTYRSEEERLRAAADALRKAPGWY